MQVHVKADGFESVSYNYPEIPFYVRTMNLSNYDGMRVLSHWHEELEFLYIFKGHMWYHVNDEIVYLDENQGLFVNSCQLHYGFSKDQSECYFAGILFHPDLISSNTFIEEHFISPFIHDEAYPYVKLRQEIPWQKRILQDLEQAAALEHADKPGLRMQLSSLRILTQLQEQLPFSGNRTNQSNQSRQLLKIMILWIHDHYTERIRLQQIADSAGISKSFCGILFQQHTGMSPIEYLNEYRLQQAKALLQDTDLTILEIALQTGFNGSSYFCEMFKRRYGITPRSVRHP